jgi:hypothetical protein
LATNKTTKTTNKLTDTLTLTEAHNGFWLYDHTQGMNLAMKAKSETDAFVEALTYYQKKLKETQAELSVLHRKVDSFLSQFKEEKDEWTRDGEES